MKKKHPPSICHDWKKTNRTFFCINDQSQPFLDKEMRLNDSKEVDNSLVVQKLTIHILQRHTIIIRHTRSLFVPEDPVIENYWYIMIGHLIC